MPANHLSQQHSQISASRARRRGIIAVVALVGAVLFALWHWASENGYF